MMSGAVDSKGLDSAGFTIDMRDAEVRFRVHIMQCVHGLALEINSGMKLSRHGSLLKLVQSSYGVRARTKRGALVEMVALLHASDPEWVESSSVVRALVSK